MQSAVYAFLGSDHGRKRNSIQRIRKKHPDADFLSYSLLQGELEQVIDSLEHNTLFTSERVIVVSGVDAPIKKSHLTLFATHCKDPGENTILLLLSDEPTLPPPLASVIPRNHVRIYSEFKKLERFDWMMKKTQEKGIEISPQVCEQLAEMAGGHQDDLENILSYLVSLDKKNISSIDTILVREYASQKHVFAIVDACYEKKASEILRILEQLRIQKESGVSIITRIRSHFRKLHAIAIAIQSGTSESRACSEHGLFNRSAVRAAITYVKERGVASLSATLTTFAITDTLLRSTPLPCHHTILELCFLRIVRDLPLKRIFQPGKQTAHIE